jgi:hypothetical protein
VRNLLGGLGWLLVSALVCGTAGAEEPPPFELGGRVFLRESVISQDGGDWLGQMEVASARLTLDLHRGRWRAQVELEAADGNAELRDAYVKVDVGRGLGVRAGRFKLPMSRLELESVLDLPSIGRGMLSDVLDHGLGVAGRRAGAQLEWKGGQKDDDVVPFLRGGLYQAVSATGATQAGPVDEALALDAGARGGVDVALLGGELEVALGASWRTLFDTRTGALERFWAVGLDASFEREWCWGGLRAWVEGFAGTSPVDSTPMTTGDPIFVAGRGELAVRRGGVKKGAWYLEGYALASGIDVNTDNASDLAVEAAVGANVGEWRRWRVGVQLEGRSVKAFTPDALGGSAGAITDLVGVRLQLAVGF